MGRKLTSYERLMREFEREEEREKRAEAVAARREEARRQREQEEEERREEKERQLEMKISAANRQVEAYEKFMLELTGLHKAEVVSGAQKFHALFSAVDSATPDQIKYLTKPRPIGDFTFHGKPFDSTMNAFSYPKQEDLNNAKQYIQFSEDDFVAHFKKIRFGKTGWTFYFIFLLPIALLHYLSIRKNIYNPIEYQAFIDTQRSLVTQLEAERERLLKEHETSERNRIETERKRYSAELAAAREAHELALQAYQQKVVKYEKAAVDIQEKHDRAEKEKVNWYTNAGKGDADALLQLLELLFPIRFKLDKEFLSLDPSTIDVGYYLEESSKLTLAISLDKELNYVPESGYRLTPSGKDVSDYVLTQKARNEHTNSFICSLALAYLRSAFEHCTALQSVRIQVSIPSTNKATGTYEDEVILYLEADRPTCEKINFDAIDPTEAIKNFNYAFKPVGKKGEFIASKITDDTIIWSTPDDADLNLDPHIQLTFYKYLGVQSSSPARKNEASKIVTNTTNARAVANILLQEIEVGSKFSIIKLLYDELGGELVAIKSLIDSLPAVIYRSDSLKKCEEFAKTLRYHGAKVEVRIDK